jgi:hypothetical protein
MQLGKDSFCTYAPRYVAIRTNADAEIRASELSTIQNGYEELCHPK